MYHSRESCLALNNQSSRREVKHRHLPQGEILSEQRRMLLRKKKLSIISFLFGMPATVVPYYNVLQVNWKKYA